MPPPSMTRLTASRRRRPPPPRPRHGAPSRAWRRRPPCAGGRARSTWVSRRRSARGASLRSIGCLLLVPESARLSPDRRAASPVAGGAHPRSSQRSSTSMPASARSSGSGTTASASAAARADSTWLPCPPARRTRTRPARHAPASRRRSAERDDPLEPSPSPALGHRLLEDGPVDRAMQDAPAGQAAERRTHEQLEGHERRHRVARADRTAAPGSRPVPRSRSPNANGLPGWMATRHSCDRARPPRRRRAPRRTAPPRPRRSRRPRRPRRAPPQPALDVLEPVDGDPQVDGLAAGFAARARAGRARWHPGCRRPQRLARRPHLVPGGEHRHARPAADERARPTPAPARKRHDGRPDLHAGIDQHAARRHVACRPRRIGVAGPTATCTRHAAGSGPAARGLADPRRPSASSGVVSSTGTTASAPGGSGHRWRSGRPYRFDPGIGGPARRTSPDHGSRTGRSFRRARHVGRPGSRSRPSRSCPTAGSDVAAATGAAVTRPSASSGGSASTSATGWTSSRTAAWAASTPSISVSTRASGAGSGRPARRPITARPRSFTTMPTSRPSATTASPSTPSASSPRPPARARPRSRGTVTDGGLASAPTHVSWPPPRPSRRTGCGR